MQAILELNDRGYVKQRESLTLEFKQSFQFGGDSLHEYARTMVGMANNQGGVIIFGVQDKPHIPIGLLNDKIDRFDPKELNQVFLAYFSSDVDWQIDTFSQFGKLFGIISVKMAESKPVICSKTRATARLREGAIYFRYRGQTKEIRFPELNALLQAERDKEKELWMKHIQTIATVGPQAAQIIDTIRGEMDVQGTKVILDSALVDRMRFIREGQFVEKGGAPTLKLVGEIEGLLDHDHVVLNEMSYPHTQSSITNELPINSYGFQALIWKLEVKGNSRYHAEISTGARGIVHKYSEPLLQLLRDKLRATPDLVASARQDYGARYA